MTMHLGWQRVAALTSLLAAMFVLCQSQESHAATFTTSNLDDAGTWNTIYAQGFTPSVNASPDPGLSAGDSVNLDSFEFFKSGSADSATDIKLAILQFFYYDFNTPLTTSSPELVGLSDNTIASTAGIATDDPISFSFSGTSLLYGNDYGAVYVNEDGAGNLTPVLVSSMTENYTEVSPGFFAPTSNYGTNSEFQYATSNFISAGFFAAFSEAGDAKFQATLSFEAIPEPATSLLLIGGLIVSAWANQRKA